MKEVNTIFNLLRGEERENCLKDMSKYQRELFKELEADEEKAKGYSLRDLVYDFDKDFVEKILEIELEEYLKEHKEDNRRNGYTNGIELAIGDRTIYFNRPRLRKEKDFNSELLPKKKRFINDISDYVMILYAKNNSVNDIKNILQEMFGVKISTGTISKMSSQISSEVLAWRNKELQKCYFTINIDCTYIKIRDKKELIGHKVPIYIAIGTRLDGHKEIVGMYLGNEDESRNVIEDLYNKDIAESKTYWLEVFNDLKDRGVEKVLYIVSDGVVGMEEAVKEEFPNAKYQRCVVHLMRNLEKYTNVQERKSVLADFKKTYTSPTKELSMEAFAKFKEKYKGRKTIVKHAEEYYQCIIGLYDVPENIRKYIYTNNIVESANSKIKRGFYGRGALPNVESAINIIFVNLKDLEEKWKTSKVSNWSKIIEEISTVHYEEVKQYIK